MNRVDDLKPDDFGDAGWFSESGMPWHRAKAQYVELIKRVAELKAERSENIEHSADLIVRLHAAKDEARFWMLGFGIIAALNAITLVLAWFL